MTLDPADNTGHLVRNTDGVILIITTGATATNVTITVNNKNLPASGSFPRVTLTDTVIAVGSNKTFFAGPFPTAYNDANGDLNIAFSAVTNVKIGAVKAGA
jgi:hypothetical protein